ncbi:GntR family transcriptional regulator [Saccharopolyspora sp. ASAGF58]|uniref:GntR family transcriptional regulator n=1 Tax=Saccharopolyspora sp. ASAGF58 TaxID=2719023 RepID=UPI0014401106|nr:GntR family transcriptional regulator [Saccharopolyspora sp. ASAGF58]QIZ37377.1 GntR family transcriptional regulator [Saccharopolyspora sp. ASAGF58]
MAVDAPSQVDSRRQRPAAGRVYDWLRDGILTGRLAEGTFLDEVWVAESVGTSRTPVREAFHRLHAERFIDLLPRKGAQVHVVTARELDEVNATRMLIERHAGSALCADRVGAPLEMHELLDLMEEAERALDWLQAVQLNWRFHRSMVSAHGNVVLTEMYDTLQARQQRVGLRALESSPARVPVIDGQHRGIVRALDDHDSDRLQRLLGEHLMPVPEVTAVLGSDARGM